MTSFRWLNYIKLFIIINNFFFQFGFKTLRLNYFTFLNLRRWFFIEFMKSRSRNLTIIARLLTLFYIYLNFVAVIRVGINFNTFLFFIISFNFLFNKQRYISILLLISNLIFGRQLTVLSFKRTNVNRYVCILILRVATI